MMKLNPWLIYLDVSNFYYAFSNPEEHASFSYSKLTDVRTEPSQSKMHQEIKLFVPLSSEMNT